MPKPVSFAAQSFETLDTSRGPESLGPAANRPGPARLSVVENGRFTQHGGVRIRGGFEQKADLSLDAAVDDLEVQTMFDALFAKCSTKIEHTLDGETFYDIGLTQAAAEKTFLFPFRKDMFAVNQTNDGARIACSTVAAIDSGAGTFSLRGGDGSGFVSGTVYIRGIAVTGGTLSTDSFSGCSGLTASMAVGDIVTQTSTPSNFPKGTCMAELEGSAVVGGVSADPTALYWSEPSSPASPELFYNFPTAYKKSMPSPVTALKSSDSVLLIGMKRGLQYSSGFDLTTGALLTLPLANSSGFGVPNARCVAATEDGFVILTDTGRILLASQTDAGFRIVLNPNNPKADMDYPVQGFIQKNMDRVNLDENFIHYDSGSREISATIRLNNGVTREFVFQRDIGAWSTDTGKNFRCKAVFMGRTYAGDDSDSLLHLDGEGWTDNGIPINFRILTGLLRGAMKGITIDYLMHHFGGVLNATGKFFMRVILDGSVVENREFTATELRQKGLMDVMTGVGVGGGQVSAEQIGSGGQVADVFKFDVPYEFMGEGEQAQVEFETTDEATILELRYLSLEGETEGESLLTNL